jgi:thiamine monophosphate synthase
MTNPGKPDTLARLIELATALVTFGAIYQQTTKTDPRLAFWHSIRKIAAAMATRIGLIGIYAEHRYNLVEAS